MSDEKNKLHEYDPEDLSLEPLLHSKASRS